MEVMIIESLTTEEYLNICSWNLVQYRKISIPTSVAVKPGAIISSGHPLEDPVEIVVLTNENGAFIDTWQSSKEAVGVVMEDGWTR
jgi:hypothetical protein